MKMYGSPKSSRLWGGKVKGFTVAARYAALALVQTPVLLCTPGSLRTTCHVLRTALPALPYERATRPAGSRIKSGTGPEPCRARVREAFRLKFHRQRRRTGSLVNGSSDKIPALGALRPVGDDERVAMSRRR